MLGIVSAIAVAAVSALVFFTEMREYKVHTEGIVLITGASSGIGKDAAEYLADHHNFLVLAGVRKQSDFAAVEKLNKKNLLPFLIDVASHESCTTAVDNVKKLSVERNLPFVGLVNNAGIGRFSPLEFQEMDDARALFDTNVFGLLDLTKQTLPLLRASQGRVVMISSISGFVSSPFSGIYAASKFAVEALSDALRRELLSHGVSVSVVQPGYVRTQIIATSRKATEEVYKEQSSQMLALYPGVAKREGMEEMMAQQPGPELTTTPGIVHALTAAHPKTRYPVAGALGLSATAISWMVWSLSDRVKDFLF
jgi:short-subunit dehydrogenase